MLLPEHNRYPLFNLFVLGVVFALFIPLFWNITMEPPQGTGAAGHTLENTDLYQRVYPQYSYSFERLRQGALPLWNPNVLGGVPHMAQPETAIFQPLHLPFYFLPVERAMALHALLCYFLMAMFFVLFARSLDLSFPAALLGGMAYAFSGVTVVAITRPELASTLVWVPLLFFALREYTRNFQMAFAVLAGLSIGLILLAGAYMIALLFLMQAFYYAIVRAFFGQPIQPVSLWRRGWGVLLIGGIGLGIGAVQWLPAWFWYQGLNAPMEALLHLDIANRLPQHPKDLLLHLFSTGESHLPNAGYMGAATLLFAPAAFLHRYSRFEAIFFGLCVLAPILAVLVEPYPLNMAQMLPLLLFPMAFSLALLATLGMDRFFDTRQGLRSTYVRLAVVAFFIMALALLWYGDTAIRGRVVVYVILLLPAIFWRRPWPATLFGCLTALLLFTDLAFSNVALARHPIQDAPQCYQMDRELIQEARRQALSERVFFNSRRQDLAFSPNIAMMQPMRAVNARRVPLTTDKAQWWRYICQAEGPLADAPMSLYPELLLAPRNPAARLLNHLGARALIIGAQTPLGSLPALRPEGMRLRPVRSLGDWMLYANDSAYPRVRWLPVWRAVTDTEEAIAHLLSEDFEGARECTVEAEGQAFTELVRVAPDVSMEEQALSWEGVGAKIVEDSPERIVVEVETEVPGITLLADTFDSDWKVTVDGKAAPLLKVNGLFRGVATPAGNHVLEFSYRPWSVYLGRYLSLVLLLALSGWAIRLLLQRRPK